MSWSLLLRSLPNSIIVFRRIMGKLKMVEMNKNFYQPANCHLVPQHKLEIWPGYVTAVQESNSKFI